MNRYPIEAEKLLNSALVIGGGVAGVQASLDLADAGYKVYLVERTPSIGGVMAQLDKTFPTIDCSICILAPKLVECGRHQNIKLLTYSEVREVKGEAGNFTVKVERKPRYVIEEKCNGCGLCSEVCRVKIPNEFDQSLAARKAIYLPFPQAVPLKYTLDKEHCIGCGICKIACGRDAVDYDMTSQEVEIKVGSIIVAVGGDYYEPPKGEYGYKEYKNVLTALEFERLLNASGPTKGKLLRPSDGKLIKKLAFVQCVGCRSKERPYCSRVCCTFATKEAIVAKEHEKELEEVYIFYNDFRTVGKNFEEFYTRAKKEYDIRYIKGIPSVLEQKDGSVVIKYEDQEELKFKKMEVDLVVLSHATLPKKGLDKLAEVLGISLDEYGFVKELDPLASPVDTSRPGIYVCGVSSGPRDIPDSVAQASGAVARASLWVVPSEEEKEYPKEIDVYGREPRVGVFVCNCGLNIGGYVDVPNVAEYAATLPSVVYAEQNLFTCSADSIERIKAKIKEHNLNRVVVASCTPRTHEPLFRETCQEAGLNKYLFEMANIRDQCSWVHMRDYENATKKAKDLVRMTVAKARLLEPRYEKEVDIHPAALIIGGGISGMTVALSIAYHGFEVHLVEKTEQLGGLIREVDTLPPYDVKPAEVLDGIIDKVKKEGKIALHTSTTIKGVRGYIGNFEVTLDKAGKEEKITAGTIIVATGAKPFEPRGYFGYGEYKNVLTQFELEKLITENKVGRPKSVAMIQCVGAREKDGRTYCSRICCPMAIKNARYVKKQFPEADVYIIHRDIRTVGKTEEDYYV
ncbi:MAG: FAD-dependent oxidoreductase, partial [Candidatus Hydrothermarchaeota archaeon]|nr:FAD-dependent oxidoreductase [Candidatus Hydrothermarchaeota archaeon]